MPEVTQWSGDQSPGQYFTHGPMWLKSSLQHRPMALQGIVQLCNCCPKAVVTDLSSRPGDCWRIQRTAQKGRSHLCPASGAWVKKFFLPFADYKETKTKLLSWRKVGKENWGRSAPQPLLVPSLSVSLSPFCRETLQSFRAPHPRSCRTKLVGI